jgi:anti-sigma factor ChrR (cupin superfamily)
MKAAAHAYWEDSAASYALGLLTGAEAEAFEAHLETCAACQAEVAAAAETMGDLAFATAAAPPVALRDKVLAKVQGKVGLDNAVQRKVVRADSGGWQATGFAGVEVKQLSVDEATGNITSLARLAPGAVYAPHRHASHEHCYVVEGDLVFDDHALHAGDYSVSAPGTVHSPATTRSGCTLLIVHNVRDELLAAS